MDPLGTMFYIIGSSTPGAGTVHIIPLEETRPPVVIEAPSEPLAPYDGGPSYGNILIFPRVDKYADEYPPISFKARQ